MTIENERIKGISRAVSKNKLIRIEKYNLNPKLCKKCLTPLTYKQHIGRNKFCCHSCSAMYNNLGKRRHGSPPVSRECLNCKKQTKNKRFCSWKCQGMFKRKNVFAIIERGEYKSKYIDNTSLKKYLVFKKGSKCEICGLSKWRDSDIPLDVHHINGDCRDNNLSNLKLVCKNCHALTDTYGSRNKNGSRKYKTDLEREKRQKFRSDLYNLLLTAEEKTARDVAGEAVQAKQIVCVLGKDQPAS